MNKLVCCLVLLAVGAVNLQAQSVTIHGIVKDTGGNGVVATVSLLNTPYTVQSLADGSYVFSNLPAGNYTLMVYVPGMKSQQRPVAALEDVRVDFVLQEFEETLETVVIEDVSQTMGSKRLNAVENFGVYEGKKTEVVVLKDLAANFASNNPRQIYGRITGLNIWESDGADLQLGIGGRGLSPNRTSNFNTRQNGYDISADALGYPESYYTPPAEAIDRIEIVRGAASLQYGTQFGGLLNFKLKRGPQNRKIELTSRQTVGSWNFFGTFNSIGGTADKGRLNYYAYYNFKTGEGYRPNADFRFHNAFASLSYDVTEKLSFNADLTRMYYLAHQPGGLTDLDFARHARQSKRERNWFRVGWNLFSFNLTYRFTSQTQLNIRNFGLLASRHALGNMEKINVADEYKNRSLIEGKFQNFGNETRLLHRYHLFGKQHVFVSGFRAYYGTTYTRQGSANDKVTPDFYFLKPGEPDNSDYENPNRNFALFFENIFDLSDKFSLTPGIRFENIQTFTEGYYKEYARDLAGNIVAEQTLFEDKASKRSFVLAGLGISYKLGGASELYANISQNYRGINFSDLRIENPSLRTDVSIHDERGYNADIGIRGNRDGVFTYEFTGFYLSYRDRIGQLYVYDENTNRDYRLRANISDARNIGVEAFAECMISTWFFPNTRKKWSVFMNASGIDGRYVTSGSSKVADQRKVEMVPPLMLRVGTTFKWKDFSSTVQFSHTASQYSDASNVEYTASAVEGVIPSYQVMDITVTYQWNWLKAEASCNNFLQEKYFTRRAESYPGPGIIPSDGRGFYLTLQVQLGR